MSNKRLILRPRWFAALLLLAAAAIAAFYFSRPVAKVVTVTRGSAFHLVPGSVTVDAEYQEELKSELGGRIIKSDLDEGKHFKEGDFLVQLDTGDLEIEIEKLKFDHEALEKRLEIGERQAQVQLDVAHENFANVERTHKLGQMSENDFENQKRALDAAEQQFKLAQINDKNALDSDDNALKAKNRELEKMTIAAPFDGVIEKVLAHRGELIGPGTPIAILISTSRKVVARISEENFEGIQLGQKARVRFLTYGSDIYGATVSKILPTADPETQRYEVYLNVDMPLEKLVPGLNGEVEIQAGEHDNALIVPRRALFGDSLFIVKNGRVRLRKVQVGYVGLNEAEIIGGINEGDKVVVEELDTFHAGQAVRTTELAQ
ncbi:MAG TPA: efflux RND transporter periplasmic adaptor subunit [Opitutaceae bacterium]|nr:efflux RND transporter periplasmic adaptor subunit [Opitutaceae bacterium]